MKFFLARLLARRPFFIFCSEKKSLQPFFFRGCPFPEKTGVQKFIRHSSPSNKANHFLLLHKKNVRCSVWYETVTFCFRCCRRSDILLVTDRGGRKAKRPVLNVFRERVKLSVEGASLAYALEQSLGKENKKGWQIELEVKTD